MASSTYFQRLFDKYQQEGAPNGISIVKYCQLIGWSIPISSVGIRNTVRA